MSTKQITIALGVVKNEQGHYLLGKRHQPEQPLIHGKWNFLGGRIEYGETPEQAVVREIREESGFEVIKAEMLPKVFTRYRDHIDGTKLQIITIPFICQVVGQTLPETPGDPGVKELKFIKAEDLRNHDLIEGEIEILELIGI